MGQELTLLREWLTSKSRNHFEPPCRPLDQEDLKMLVRFNMERRSQPKGFGWGFCVRGWGCEAFDVSTCLISDVQIIDSFWNHSGQDAPHRTEELCSEFFPQQ